jgi:hypothetical protein
MGAAFSALISVIGGLLCWLGLSVRSTQSIEAENLFLRRQLALYAERGIKPRRIDPVTPIQLALVARFCNWRDALVVVRPETMIRWHRAVWRLFRRMKSRPGRPPIPRELQALIRRRRSALVDVPAPTSPGNHCLRFLRSSHRHVSVALRFRDHRAPQSSLGAFQRHRTSDPPVGPCGSCARLSGSKTDISTYCIIAIVSWPRISTNR